MRLDANEYQRVLGEELRELRKRQGWTRKELGEHLDTDISLQTLATYELGTRHCSVVRLVEICLALGEQPHELIARVQGRVCPDKAGHVRVSLYTLAAQDSPELRPLRRWAEGRLRQAGEEAATTDVRLDPSAIGWLAQLCGMETAQLVTRLREL